MPLDVWCPPGEVRLLALSPNAARAAVLDAAGVVTVVSTGATVGEASVEVGPGALAVAISDDGSTLAVIDASRGVRVVPVAAPGDARMIGASCGLLVNQTVVPAPVTERVSVSPQDLVFSPDADALIVSDREIYDREEYYGGGWISSRSLTLLVRRSPGLSELLLREEATHPITYSTRDAEAEADHAVSAAFSSDGRWLALLRKSGRLMVRAVAGGAVTSPPAATIRAFAFVPGEAAVIAACGDRVIRWDVAGERGGEFTATGEVVSLACAPDGSRIAYVDAGGDVAIAASSGEVLEVLPRVHASPACAVAWPGDRVVIRCADGAVIVRS